MHFRVGRHFNVKVVPGLGSDETHQIAGVLELAAGAVAARQIAAQRHQALDAHRLECGQLRGHSGARRADARQVRSRALPLGQNIAHGRERTLLRRAARAKSYRAELRLECVQLLAHQAQLLHAFGRFRRKELKAQGRFLGIAHDGS